MVKNNRGVIGIALTLIVVCVLIGGGYLYLQSRQDNTVEPTPTPAEPTPTPTRVIPQATVISAIPTPTNLREWKSSTPDVNYEWTFKYPPHWSEYPILKGFEYRPSNISPEDYNLN